MFGRLSYLAARCRALFHRGAFDRDLREELETHTKLLAEDYVRRGLSAEEALRRARLDIGGVAQLEESHREVRSLPFLETAWRDTRFAVRSLRRDASYAVFAVLILALGIGASTTVFSVVNALLLRPLPVLDARNLVWVKAATASQEGDLSGETLKVNPFVEFRDANKSFSGMAAYFAFYGIGDRMLTGEGEPERLTAVPVSENFFPFLGVAPRLGRNFSREESDQNRPVVILSEGFWKRRFASDPNIVGRTLTMNERATTVIGVVPFDFGSVLAPGTRVDLYLPLPLNAAFNRMGNTLSVIGRLRQGVTLRQAQAEADVLIGPIGARNEREGLRLAMSPLEQRVRGRMQPALYVLVGAVGVVMLIVCANLSNLQLARAAARQKEMAIRVALGAGLGRLIRQTVTESLLLSGIAAVAALGIAAMGTRLVASLDSIRIPLRESVRLDPAAFGFAVSAAVAIGIVLGFAPLVHVPGRSIQRGLGDSSRGSSAGSGQTKLRSTLVVFEIAFACVLLVGAGLLIRSFLHVLGVNLGFEPARAAAIRIEAKGDRTAHIDEVLRRVRSLPGVDAAGVTDVLPLGGNRSWTVGAKGRVYDRANPPSDAFVRIVTDGYFASMGIPMRSGRDLNERDRAGSKPVIVINETLARTLWPGEDPIGKIVDFLDTDREVVGVASDVRHIALEQESGGEMYLPMRQTRAYFTTHLLVRSSIAPAAMASAIRTALLPLEPNLANEFMELRQLVDRSVSPRRFVVVLLAGFSAFALLLAALGVYAVIAHAVSQRKQEIGIRMALGATAADIRSGILRHTLGLASIGMAIGIAASWILTRALAGMVFGVTSTDPVTYLAMTATLTLAAAAAGYLPARYASRTDPMAALRMG